MQKQYVENYDEGALRLMGIDLMPQWAVALLDENSGR